MRKLKSLYQSFKTNVLLNIILWVVGFFLVWTVVPRLVTAANTFKNIIGLILLIVFIYMIYNKLSKYFNLFK